MSRQRTRPRTPPAAAGTAVGASWWRRGAARWELLAYVSLVVIALGMRLWDLGGRTLHYDEILHSWYSWRFAVGLGYDHTPLMHGPFLFHAAAATYKILGSSDFAARLLPALFGAALVGLPYLLRRELGRPGALMVAVMLAASPSLLYFSRFARNDIYMAVWVLALVIVLWRYLEQPRPRLLVAWAALWAFAFTTKETAFMAAGILGLYLLVRSLPDIRGWVTGKRRLSDFSPPGVLLLLLVTLTLPLWAAASGLVQDWFGITLVNLDPNHPEVVAGTLVRAEGETGAPIGAGLYVAVFISLVLMALSVVVGLLWNWKRWLLLGAVFLAIWIPLYSSLGTNWRGLFTGDWGSLGYWVAQQPVERASQPWYFYVLLGANYEFLALVPALLGIPLLLRRRSPFDLFVIYWAVATFLAYSYAGEKMPWLMVGVTLPMIVLAGRSMGLLVEWIPWSRLRAVRAIPAFLVGSMLLAMLTVALLSVVRQEDFASSGGFWAGLLVALAAAAGLAALARRTGIRPVGAVAALGAVALLLGMTVWVAGRASYSYASFERPNEMLVYSQTGQETTRTAQIIDRIARESGKGKEGLRLLVGESDNFAWQWRWYLRGYGQVTIRSLKDTPLDAPPEADVVLMSQTVEGSNKEALAGFTRVGELHHLWWFPNTTYNRLTPLSIMGDMAERAGWRGALDYFFSRRLSSEMYQSQGVVYVIDEYAHLADSS